MKKLLELINKFEERNNISITVEIFGDGSASVKEFWDEEAFKECESIEHLYEFLGTGNLKKSSNGRCVRPVVILEYNTTHEIHDLSPKRTAKELISIGFSSKQYDEGVQSDRKRRLGVFLEKEIPVLIELEKRLIEFGEQVLKLLKKHEEKQH